MKKLMLCLAIVMFTSPAFAGNDTYEIERNPYGIDNTEIQMQQKSNYDPSDRYRGTIDSDGSTRMRDYNGNTLRGNIDQEGYGKLHDQDGNSYRVRSR